MSLIREFLYGLILIISILFVHVDPAEPLSPNCPKHWSAPLANILKYL